VAIVGIAVVGGGVALAAEGPDSYKAVGGDYVGVRATAVGLPQIGMHGTVGAGELMTSLRHYHDDGLYARDLAAVAGAARTYLDARLDEAASGKPTRTCSNRYRRQRVRGVQFKLYRRVRTCRTIPAAGLTGKPAIVLDIDETSLSNYDFLLATNFTALGLVPPAALGTGRAIAPTLALYRAARKRGVAVFFVTGRPELARIPTESNLRAAGYDQGWDGLSFKPSGPTTLEYKAGQRKQIESRGYDIVVNLGDQESDLDGGHADRGFKLPNPFYFIGDA
jgi:acid phosphatase